MISRIGPEIDVIAFKQKINVDKVYKTKSDRTEITNGLIGTGMVVIDGQDVYEISLEGLQYKSADLTGDGLVDQRDITKYIRYIVFGELDLGKPDNKPDTTAPTVMLEATQVFSSLILILKQMQTNIEWTVVVKMV